MPQVAAQSRDGIYNTGTTLENDKSLLKPDRCRHTAHHQRVSLFTSAIPRTIQPTIQNHLRRHLLSSTSNTLYSTLLYEPNSTLNSTQPNSTQPNSTQQNNSPTHHPVFSPQSATRSTPSPLSRFNPKDSPPEGRRMIPGHDTP